MSRFLFGFALIRRAVVCFCAALLLVQAGLSAVEDRTIVPPLTLASSSQALGAMDAAGNRYITGLFSTEQDFNPNVGLDVKSVPSGLSSYGYLTRFNADGSYAWTTRFGGDTETQVDALYVSGSHIYVGGSYSGAARVNATGTAATAPGMGFSYGFVLALNTSDGTAVTTFGKDLGGGTRNGFQTLESTNGNAQVRAITGDGTAMFVGGRFTGTTFRVGTGSGVNAISSNDHAFATKISAASSGNGEASVAFNGGVPIRAYATAPMRCNALALTSGGTLFFGGAVFGDTPVFNSNPGIAYTATGGDGFVFAVNSTTGALTTAFDGEGFLGFGGTSQDEILALSTQGTTLYATGSSSGSSVGFNGAATVPAGVSGSFIFSVQTGNGQPVASFGTNGIIVTNFISLTKLTAAGARLYAAGELTNTSATLSGSLEEPSTGLVVFALDATTGARVSAFSGNGSHSAPIGGFGSRAGGLDVSVDGSKICVTGSGNSAHCQFVMPDTGVLDYVVATTIDGSLSTDTPRETFRTAMTKIRFGGTIRFDAEVFDLLNSSAATVINVSGVNNPLALKDDNITIDASDRRVTLNLGGLSASGSGINIQSSNNKIMGLTILNTINNGIGIAPATVGAPRPTGNVIGGDRTIGIGPNGQGLRIASCDSFGIRIDSSDNTVVRGCWIGLDAVGEGAQPNLGGILIVGGSLNTQIGGTSSGVGNVISGNIYEAVTVSDAGSNGTTMIGNVIGAAAVASSQALAVSRAEDSGTLVGRAGAANGAAGIFLSKGTQANTVGGANSGEENTIGFNGGAGIEVRAVASRRNSSKANRIARNKKGGIKLFDGSNDNIAPPTFDGVDRLVTRSGIRAVNALVRVRGSSTAPNGSVVEVFRDSGDQGEGFIGRTTVTAGKWQVEGELLPDENITATVTNLDGSTSAFSLFGKVPEAASGTPVISSATAVEGSVLTGLHYRIAASPAADDFDALNLPGGLSIDNVTGVISGAPTTAGVFVVDLTASNNNGTGSAQLTITVKSPAAGAPQITGTLAANGMKGKAFQYQIAVASPSTGVTYVASNLPPGLALDAGTGLISGVPSAEGVYAVQLRASNTAGVSVTGATFTIFSTDNVGSAAATDSDGDGISDAVELLAETDPLSAASKPEVSGSTNILFKTSLALSFTSTKDKFKTGTAISSTDVPTKVGVMVGGLMETVVLDSKGRGTNGVLTVAVKRSNGILGVTISAGNKDLDAAFAGLGFANKTTTGRTGETIPLTLFLRVVGTSDVVYACQTLTLQYKATAGKSGKASQAR